MARQIEKQVLEIWLANLHSVQTRGMGSQFLEGSR